MGNGKVSRLQVIFDGHANGTSWEDERVSSCQREPRKRKGHHEQLVVNDVQGDQVEDGPPEAPPLLAAWNAAEKPLENAASRSLSFALTAVSSSRIAFPVAPVALPCFAAAVSSSSALCGHAHNPQRRHTCTHARADAAGNTRGERTWPGRPPHGTTAPRGTATSSSWDQWLSPAGQRTHTPSQQHCKDSCHQTLALRLLHL